MRDYILEITQPGTRIRFENELLLLEAPEKETFSVPIRKAEDADQLLNYAYTILFALAARAICAA